MDMELGELLYHNPLASPADVADFRMEGPGATSFPRGRMRLESTADPGEEGDQAANQAANLVFWCPRQFPDNVQVSWDFTPLCEPGLAIAFFAAVGEGGRDLFDPSLKPRSGPYGQYHHGEMNALHISYFRRRYASERSFLLCNLRKSFGFHMVAQGADPIPPVKDVKGPYRLTLRKVGPQVSFRIRGVNAWQPELEVLRWTDDGTTYGPLLGGGYVGFRQMAPLIAEYSDLQVHPLRPAGATSTPKPATPEPPDA